MDMKIFTIKEANDVIPKVKILFDEIFLLKKKITFTRNEIIWIKEFWGKDLYDSDNADAEKCKVLTTEVEIMYKDIIKKLYKIENFGCIVKDPDTGLVDFYSVMNKEKIFLCWQYGESEIKYWHTIDSGFRGRMPVAEKIREKK